MSSYTQTDVERTYQNWARVYDWLTPIYLLGNEPRLRQETIASLHLQTGQKVLDVACGTGRNFPLILEKIGPQGKLVGVDYTPAMLARARERVERQGWENVELIQADAARIELGRKFDGALCTLAIGVIPDDRAALERMLFHVKSGGRLAIGDAKRSSRRSGRPFNWLADLLGWGAAENMTRQTWVLLREILGDYHYTEWFSGFFYVAGGIVQKGKRSLHAQNAERNQNQERPGNIRSHPSPYPPIQHLRWRYGHRREPPQQPHGRRNGGD